MKHLILLSALLYFASCDFVSEPNKGQFYGKKIDPKVTISIEQLIDMMGDRSRQRAKVKATVSEVCQTKGCWMNLLKANNTVMRVTFKDYEFFVPKDIAGKTAVVEGVAYYDTTSVEVLRHFAEDSGKPLDEINSIVNPKLELVFEAEGVYIN